MHNAPSQGTQRTASELMRLTVRGELDTKYTTTELAEYIDTATGTSELLDTLRDVMLALELHARTENPNETYIAWDKYLAQVKAMLVKHGRVV